MGRRLLYLSRTDVERTGTRMDDVIQAVEAMFREKGSGSFEMPPKPGIHTQPDSFIHAMPAYIPKLNSAGLKLVSGYPDNYKKNLPYISGLMILNDTNTGIPICVMDCTWITAMRTGAATAVAAKYLARSDSSRVGIIACGVQGRSNLEALSCLFNIKEVKAFDINIETAERFSEDMQNILKIDVEVAKDVKEAVKKMDIVVTSGPINKEPIPIIEDSWLGEGSFVSPVDFDSLLKAELLNGVDKLATDDIRQMDYYREQGYFKTTPKPYADLGEIVSGLRPGREDDDERIISINLGIALEDIAVAPIIYHKAINDGLGIELPL